MASWNKQKQLKVCLHWKRQGHMQDFSIGGSYTSILLEFGSTPGCFTIIIMTICLLEFGSMSGCFTIIKLSLFS